MKRRNAGDWTDDAESDPGIALLELFAYLGDMLGFGQEQIAAEARLKTTPALPARTCGGPCLYLLAAPDSRVDAWRA
jgi:hypothetical protein